MAKNIPTECQKLLVVYCSTWRKFTVLCYSKLIICVLHRYICNLIESQRTIQVKVIKNSQPMSMFNYTFTK